MRLKPRHQLASKLTAAAWLIRSTDEEYWMMQNPTCERESLGEGVYYAPQDYASLRARLVIIVIDLTLLIFCSLLISGILSEIGKVLYGLEYISLSFNYTLLFLSYLYLAVLKPTRHGTLGYWLKGYKVINLQGKRPSFWQMTYRFVLLIFGPFHIVVDYFWLGGDEHRQTFRDKLVGTYVIRQYATPLGRGQVALVPYFFWGLSFLFREVKSSQ